MEMKDSCKHVLTLIEDGYGTYDKLLEATDLTPPSLRSRLSELHRRGIIAVTIDPKTRKREYFAVANPVNRSDARRLKEGAPDQMERIWRLIESGEPFPKMKFAEVIFPSRHFEKLDLVTQNREESEDIVFLISDFHVGCKNNAVNKDSWEGIFTDLLHNTLKLLARVDASVKVVKVHIFLLGDVITGENVFPGQPFEIDLNIIEQLNIFVNNMKAYIEAILALTNVEIELHCVCGNHGRVSRYSSMDTNWDRIAYQMLERSIKNDKIKFNISPDFYQMVNIRGHKYLLTHGDGVPMYMNTPYYGILQATLKWNGSIGPHDVLCVGHFHQTAMFSINNTTILLNGSAYAQDNFVLKNLKVKTDTRFWMFGVSDKRPITWSYRVDIDGFEKPKEDAECQKIAASGGQS